MIGQIVNGQVNHSALIHSAASLRGRTERRTHQLTHHSAELRQDLFGAARASGREILASVERVAGISRDFTNAAIEQTAAIEPLNETVDHMDAVTQ